MQGPGHAHRGFLPRLREDIGSGICGRAGDGENFRETRCSIYEVEVSLYGSVAPPGPNRLSVRLQEVNSDGHSHATLNLSAHCSPSIEVPTTDVLPSSGGRREEHEMRGRG